MQVTRYMVVTGRQASAEQAQQLAERLRENGVESPWVIPRGKLEGRVSLGLYLKRTSAEKQRAELKRRGFTVEIKPRHRSQSSIWLDLELQGSNLAGLQKLVRKTQPGLSLRPTACPPLKTAQK